MSKGVLLRTIFYRPILTNIDSLWDLQTSPKIRLKNFTKGKRKNAIGRIIVLRRKTLEKFLVKKNSEGSFFHLEIRAEEKILFFRYFFCEIRLFYRTKNWRGKKSARNHFAPVSIFRNFYHPIIYGLKMKRGRRKSMKEVSSWRWNESEI